MCILRRTKGVVTRTTYYIILHDIISDHITCGLNFNVTLLLRCTQRTYAVLFTYISYNILFSTFIIFHERSQL